jgi:hypothetical protein
MPLTEKTGATHCKEEMRLPERRMGLFLIAFVCCDFYINCQNKLDWTGPGY